MKENIEEFDLVRLIAQALHDKKAFNMLALDVRGQSSITDFFIIAEGNVERHVKALAQTVAEELRKANLPAPRIEGDEEGDWIVIDCWQVVVHLFVPDLRQKYQLERLWEGAKLVELQLDWVEAENAPSEPASK